MTPIVYLYLIECKGGGIYVGITSNIEERYAKHVEGTGALYTKLNPPVRLIASCAFPSRKEATRVERKIKKLTKGEKLAWAEAFKAGYSYQLGFL